LRLFKLILLLMLVASIVPTLMVGGISVSHTRELLIRNAQELAQERVKQLSLKAHHLLDEPSRAAVNLARVPGFFQLPLAEQRMHVATILSQQQEVVAVTLFSWDMVRIPGLQGFAIKDIPPSEVAEHEARGLSLIRQGPQSLLYSDAYLSPSRHQAVLTLAFPVGDPAKGYVAVEISLSGLADMLEQERVGSSGFAYVADRRGRLVAGPPALGLEPGSDLSARPAVAHLLQSLAESPDSAIFRVGNFGGGSDRVVGAYSVLPETGWAIVSEQPIALAYKQVDTMERRMLYGLLYALGLAALLAWLFSGNLTRPLKGFAAGALEIARGKFGVEVKFNKKNELGDLAQTFNYMSKQLQAYDQENRGLYESLEKGYLETIVALANSIDSKDAYTRGHSQRVGDVAMEIGREMGLTESDLKHLHYGGILHDIGKIGIVDAILGKQSRLTDDEMNIMRDHPVIGATIIEPVTFLVPVMSAVKYHHENWDGTGYPDKLKGEDIPLIARIVACADTFDACTSTRPYQKAMPLEKAMDVLNSVRGARLDPSVVDALRRVLEKKGLRVEGHRQPVKLAS
jgi:putative nucleotidyltransferase with HDIG domain